LCIKQHTTRVDETHAGRCHDSEEQDDNNIAEAGVRKRPRPACVPIACERARHINCNQAPSPGQHRRSYAQSCECKATHTGGMHSASLENSSLCHSQWAQPLGCVSTALEVDGVVDKVRANLDKQQRREGGQDQVPREEAGPGRQPLSCVPTRCRQETGQLQRRVFSDEQPAATVISCIASSAALKLSSSLAAEASQGCAPQSRIQAPMCAHCVLQKGLCEGSSQKRE
jgi:hypothetical protein